MEDPLAAALQAQASADKPEPPHNPRFFRCLCYLEFTLVWLIGLGILGCAVHWILWTIFGVGPNIHARIIQAVREFNGAWKIGLIILIPLFFRPVSKFLIRLKRAHGWDTDDEITPKSADQESYGSQRR